MTEEQKMRYKMFVNNALSQGRMLTEELINEAMKHALATIEVKK